MPTFPGDEASELFTHTPGQTFTRSFSDGPQGEWELSGPLVELEPGLYRASAVLDEAGQWVWIGQGQPPANTVQLTWDVAARAGVAVGDPLEDGSLAVVLQRGDDYASTEGRQRVWSFQDRPNLAGGTVAMTVSSGGTAVLVLAGVASGAYPGTQTVTVEFTAEQTATLKRPSYAYELVATLANGHVLTLAADRVFVR